MAGADPDERRRRLAAAIERFGPWTAPHNVHLGDGIWTITDRQPMEDSKLRRVTQLVADSATKPISELRVLDLACEGGIHGIELARKGAEVIAIEGREEHVERARFAATEIGLPNFRVEVGDVRNVTADSHGTFDVVLCLGILYHLDAPDVFEFVHALRGLCRRSLILDTQISLTSSVLNEHRGASYAGSVYLEHERQASESEQLKRPRASIGNTASFWLSMPSLFNLLSDAGFSSVLEAQVPRPAERHADRITLVAFAGAYEDVPRGHGKRTSPQRWPEKERLSRDLQQTVRGRSRRALGRLRLW